MIVLLFYFIRSNPNMYIRVMPANKVNKGHERLWQFQSLEHPKQYCVCVASWAELHPIEVAAESWCWGCYQGQKWGTHTRRNCRAQIILHSWLLSFTQLKYGKAFFRYVQKLLGVVLEHKQMHFPLQVMVLILVGPGAKNSRVSFSVNTVTTWTPLQCTYFSVKSVP